MKKLSKIFFISLSVVACSLFAACSDDGEKAPVEVVFTELYGVDTSLLNECDEVVGSFELRANGNWHLNSSKMWVELSLTPEGEFYNDIQGVEGKYTVYVKVTNATRGFSESQAVVSLIAGDKKETVATVVRPAKEYELDILNSESVAIEAIEMGDEAVASVVISANFDCAVLSWPLWMNEPLFTEVGYELSVSDYYTPMQLSGEVVFGDINAEVTCTLPVSYAGMNPEEIIVGGEHSPWGWYVTLDGKTFSNSSDTPSGESVTTTVENNLDFTVKCFNYDCKFIVVEEVNNLFTVKDWIKVEQGESDRSIASVSVDPFTTTTSVKSRMGYVFAVPAAAYESFVEKLNGCTDAEAFVDENLSYVLMQLTQIDLEGTLGFGITDSKGNKVDCYKEVEYYEWVCSELGIEDVTAANLVCGESYTINTRLTASEWSGNLGLEYLDGTSVRLKNWSVEKILGEDGYYRIKLTVPSNLNEPVRLRLYTPQIINIKALVIRPVTQK